MKKSMIIIITHLAVSVNGVTIPQEVVSAIAAVEGGRTGKATRERNGCYSYGVYQLSKAFLADVNTYHGTTFTSADVRDKDWAGALACSLGLIMIREKRKCDLKTAAAAYNGGWKNRNTKTCRDYADRVMALAGKGAKK